MIPLSAGWIFFTIQGVWETNLSSVKSVHQSAAFNSIHSKRKVSWISAKKHQLNVWKCLGLITWVFVQPSSASFRKASRITAHKPTSTQFTEEFLPFIPGRTKHSRDVFTAQIPWTPEGRPTWHHSLTSWMALIPDRRYQSHVERNPWAMLASNVRLSI